MDKLSAEWLQARSEIVATLVANGILESRNGSAGFWQNETWISVYDLLEE